MSDAKPVTKVQSFSERRQRNLRFIRGFLFWFSLAGLLIFVGSLLNHDAKSTQATTPRPLKTWERDLPRSVDSLAFPGHIILWFKNDDLLQTKVYDDSDITIESIEKERRLRK